MRINTLRSLGDVILDANGNVVTSGGSVTDTFGAALTAIATGASNYATAQQANQGITTLSNVAMIGIGAFVLVKIFGK